MLRGLLSGGGIFALCICLVLITPVTAGAEDSSKISITSVTAEQKVTVGLSESSWYGSDMSVTCYAPGNNVSGGVADNVQHIVYLDQIKAAASFSFAINKPVAQGEYRLVLGCKGSRLEKKFVFGGNSQSGVSSSADINLPAPQGVKASQTGATSVKITWKAVSGASGYKVLRKTSKGQYAEVGSTTGTSYTDKKAKAGKTYYYAVTAKQTAAGSCEISKAVKVSVLSVPKAKVKAGKKKVTVSWKKLSNAKGYKVYVSTKKKGGYKLKKTVAGKKKISCVIKKLKSRKTYYIKVAAYIGSGKKSVVGSKSAALKVKVK